MRTAGEKPKAQPPTLERFLAEVADIAPDSSKMVLPKDDLIEDLGFDSLAFSRLALLLDERYGIGGLSTVSMRTEKHLTVEGFFRHCVLEVLGFAPEERGDR